MNNWQCQWPVDEKGKGKKEKGKTVKVNGKRRYTEQRPPPSPYQKPNYLQPCK